MARYCRIAAVDELKKAERICSSVKNYLSTDMSAFAASICSLINSSRSSHQEVHHPSDMPCLLFRQNVYSSNFYIIIHHIYLMSFHLAFSRLPDVTVPSPAADGGLLVHLSHGHASNIQINCCLHYLYKSSDIYLSRRTNFPRFHLLGN